MGESNGITENKSSFLALETVPCVLDNKPWEGLEKTYDLKDPHSADGKVLVGGHLYRTLLPAPFVALLEATAVVSYCRLRSSSSEVSACLSQWRWLLANTR
jgi:hypothetical protein